MKTFDSLSHAERTKIRKFHSIHYDLNILDVASKQLMTNPDPDFICCLGSKLSTFIKDEVLPLIERHDIDIRTSRDAFKTVDSIINTIDHETENIENPENCVADN